MKYLRLYCLFVNSESNLEDIITDTLTDDDGIVYSSLGAVQNRALTDGNGIVHESVDKAITYNDAVVINNAVSSSTGFNTLDELVAAYESLINPNFSNLTSLVTDE